MSTPPLSSSAFQRSSIHSGMDALGMSYGKGLLPDAGEEEGLTPEELEKAAAIATTMYVTAIQKVVKDTTLSPLERNRAIQKIIRGENDVTKGAAAETKVAEVTRTKAEPPPQMDSSSESEDGSSSDEEEEDSDDETEEEEEKNSEDEAEEEGEAWASSSSYESSSSSEDGKTPKTAEVVTAEAQVAVAAAAVAFIMTANSEQDDPARSEALEKQRRRAQLLVVEAQLDRELQGHGLLEEEQRRRESEFQRSVEKERPPRVSNATAAAEKALGLIRTLREEEELKERNREEQEERARVAKELASMQEKQQQAQVRAAAAVAESQRLLQEELKRDERRIQDLQEEADREERRIRYLQEDMERAAQRRRLHEEQLRLRALQVERERQEQLAQEELHHRLEMEQIQRGRGHEERQMMQTHRQDLVHEAARVVAPQNVTARRDPSFERSLRASQALASRQGQDSRSASSPARSMPYAPPASHSRSNSQSKPSRYDGVEDDELNWRLDSYVSLSDFTIIVNRANPGPHAPDFETLDVAGIDFVVGSGGVPKQDIYYVHKAMIAVGSHRSELLGRRIREAENSRGGAPDGHSSEVNVHETVMLESAANAMGMVLDFCYNPDCPLDVNVENAVPLVYLGKRYKIRALLEQAEAYVMENILSTTAMYFLLDSYLFRLDEILNRSIDVTAANLADTVDFDPIYRLPPDLFRRIILSKELRYHADDIDVEYFRDLTKPRIMPDIDPKVALMILKFYVDLILVDDENCNIMEMLPGDSLMNRCISVVAKYWKEEVCEPMIIDFERDSFTVPVRGHNSSHHPAAIHRSLPAQLQNYLLEKCLIEAKNNSDSAKAERESFEVKKNSELESWQAELENSKLAQEREINDYRNQLLQLQRKAAELAKQLTEKTIAMEEYKEELKNFRRVPGIHNFGEVSTIDPKIIDKTTCTYSANPDHHFPNHRRGDRRPTQMPIKGTELDNLGKENGYLYEDGKGELLPVFYYRRKI
ncbi:hypothetical protein ACHAW5_006263 [Stephanodiscus triporus]|uniref:BTB domain-containing protein n=1 Tax=Stephanodiscus triporus TaxID=2934178 RepID=A0ABD3MTN9_9STRA